MTAPTPSSQARVGSMKNAKVPEVNRSASTWSANDAQVIPITTGKVNRREYRISTTSMSGKNR